MTDPKIARILVLVDFSEITRSVLDHARHWAKLNSAELILLHVVHLPVMADSGTWLDPVISPSLEQDIRKQMIAAASAKMRELAQECETAGLKTQSLVREGVPTAEIIKCVEETKADLAIIGSHGQSAISHFLMGSVADRVVRRAPCHVLCIRPRPGEKTD